MLHRNGQVHAACPNSCLCSMSMSMLHEHVNAAWLSSWNQRYGHAAWIWKAAWKWSRPGCISMHVHFYAAWTQACSMDWGMHYEYELAARKWTWTWTWTWRWTWHGHGQDIIGSAHNGTKAELGICGGGGTNWVKNGAPYILIFTAILSLLERVKTLNGRYLLKESFFQTILLKNEYFKASNRTWKSFNF
jgi:hypothetical protein